jgi:uncharacterized membrane protein YeaQ/YmgE (transglycosylase-associated protein family)
MVFFKIDNTSINPKFVNELVTTSREVKMTFVDIIGWIVIGLIVGAIARFLVPGRDPMGCVMTMVLGILGAVIGGYISRYFLGHSATTTGYARPGFLVSLVGAIILVLLFRLFRRRTV